MAQNIVQIAAAIEAKRRPAPSLATSRI
jgi:hypothetical protein